MNRVTNEAPVLVMQEWERRLVRHEACGFRRRGRTRHGVAGQHIERTIHGIDAKWLEDAPHREFGHWERRRGAGHEDATNALPGQRAGDAIAGRLAGKMNIHDCAIDAARPRRRKGACHVLFYSGNVKALVRSNNVAQHVRNGWIIIHDQHIQAAPIPAKQGVGNLR